VEVSPTLIDAGLATTVTVGRGGGATVTVAVAEVVPPAPVAVAVYVVVAEGLTVCVPPVPGNVYELLSLPFTTTCVALAAVIVSSDDPPAVRDAGLAAMVTVGALTGVTVIVAVAVVLPLIPVAVARYVVVDLGVTAWFPPLDCRV
jgi:hypothetical protein